MYAEAHKWVHNCTRQGKSERSEGNTMCKPGETHSDKFYNEPKVSKKVISA